MSVRTAIKSPLWSLSALGAVLSLASVSYRAILTAKFGTQELLTWPLLALLVVVTGIFVVGLRHMGRLSAAARAALGLLSVAVVGLLMLLLPGSPFPFLGVVHQPWGGYVLALLLTSVGAALLRRGNSSSSTTLSRVQAIAVAAAGIALFTWVVALGGFAYFYANK